MFLYDFFNEFQILKPHFRASSGPSSGSLKGRILTLRKPLMGMFAVDGYMTIVSDKVSMFF
jgi:hypothetical protein